MGVVDELRVPGGGTITAGWDTGVGGALAVGDGASTTHILRNAKSV